ncbi:MAG TPA: LacI family DNA-binding transcriptional regulator [Candidatus Limnocylindrales bacterium]|nr:LacI family DNA-binding transcriptional regulator [Candidatus Limnocylindrales bacterium]
MTRRLAEVAKYVGVSEATVSRVLNGRSGISDTTRNAVLTALDVLGYERPVKLRGQRARLVGLVLPELQNPIFPAFAEVVAGALAKKGFTPVLCTRTTDGVAESDYVDMLLDQQVSGVIFAGGNYAQADADHDHYHRLLRRGLPAILVNASIDGLAFPRVSADDAVAVDQAYGHLASLGHKKIGLVLGPSDHMPSRRKALAFKALVSGAQGSEALVSAAAAGSRSSAARAQSFGTGAQPTGAQAAACYLVEHTFFSMEGGHAAATRLIERGATGLICASDVLALGAVRGARRLGLDVPGDVSIVGYDDSAVMTCTDPPLTTIRQPIEAMGQAAVQLLIAEIAGSPVVADELLFEPELVVRASTSSVH